MSRLFSNKGLRFLRLHAPVPITPSLFSTTMVWFLLGLAPLRCSPSPPPNELGCAAAPSFLLCVFVCVCVFLFRSVVFFFSLDQSASWRWPFYALLTVVLAMVALSAMKYKQLKKQHLL